jgi:hypothetical protein
MMMTTTTPLQIIQSQELSKNSGPKYFSSSFDKSRISSYFARNWTIYCICTYQCSIYNFLSTAGYASINDVPKAALTQILLNHVVSGSVKSTDLTTTYIKTLAKGTATTNNLSMFVNTAGGKVMLNGVATVTTADIIASNGVVHVVDKVIGLPTIVTHALANPNFTSLVGALTGAGQPDFVTILSGDHLLYLPY